MLATKAEKVEAERLARQANAKLGKIRDAERLAENKGLLGRTFKTRNNFSCPEKPSDYWWLYTKVQKVDESGYLSVIEFQIDKHKSITIRCNEFRHNMDGHQEISKTAFNKAWHDFNKKIATIVP